MSQQDPSPLPDQIPSEPLPPGWTSLNAHPLKPDFAPWPSIPKYATPKMRITEKVDGTNAQITFYEDAFAPSGLRMICGKRTSYCYPQHDNYGFAAWAHANEDALREFLGLGTHYGEWAGPGIQNSCGLKKKTFVLFSHPVRYKDRPLPPNVVYAPCLYEGPVDSTKVEQVANDLKTNGSKLVPGWTKVEGVVVEINGHRSKYVFSPEETAWNKKPSSVGMNPKLKTDYTYLCQPIRLAKLIASDETFKADYPKSLPLIVKAYMADLDKEGQFPQDPAEVKLVRKDCGGQVFAFVKEFMNKLQKGEVIE